MVSAEVYGVDRSTWGVVWPVLRQAIHDASFIALDLELSGLGSKKPPRSVSVEERYAHLCTVVTTHAVISMGVACFQAEGSAHGLKLTHRLFDILLLSQKPYVVNPSSLQFLITHGFDFNRQYSKGLSFDPGLELSPPPETCSQPSAREIFLHILSSHKPVVLHNGFMDLIFLYYSFYGPLPKNLWTFVADLSEMFQGGLYDTKNMAEFGIREPASYLEYLFHKSLRHNLLCQKEGESFVELVHSPCQIREDVLAHVSICHSPTTKLSSVEVCLQHANHGYCDKGTDCPRSHDIHLALDLEESVIQQQQESKNRKKQRRKRKRESHQVLTQDLLGHFVSELEQTRNKLLSENGSPTMADGSKYHLTRPETVSQTTKPTESENDSHTMADGSKHHQAREQPRSEMLFQTTKPIDSPTSAPQLSGHRAGVDAFMTGFCFGCYALRLAASSRKENGMASFPKLLESMSDMSNKIALGGKPVPLLVTKSLYCSTSACHRAYQARSRVSDSIG